MASVTRRVNFENSMYVLTVFIVSTLLTTLPTMAAFASSNSTSTSVTIPTTTTTMMTTTTTQSEVGDTTTTLKTDVTTTTTLLRLRLPKSGAWTILEIGDSVGTDLGGGLFTELRKYPNIHLELKGKASTGLSNSWFYNWPVHLEEYLKEFHPKLTIVLLGGNDEQSMDVGGHSAYFGGPVWRMQYERNVALMMREATSMGSEVLWVGMPVMAPPGYSEGMKIINSVFQEEARLISGVTFLPTWKYFASKNGQFQYSALVNGKEQTIREPDGIHPTVIGEDVLATYVVEALHTIYDIPVKPAYPDFIDLPIKEIGRAA